MPDRPSSGSRGHIDGIAQYVAPGRVLLLVPDDAAHENHAPSAENLARLADVTDAAGRLITEPIESHEV